MSITADRSYTTIDKSGWGPGAWQEEPDKLQWVDEATGLDCLIVRNRLGALCGYVGVPPEHPWHGIAYNQSTDRTAADPDDWDNYETRPETKIEVHGSLTYSDSCQEGEDESKGICHIPLPGRSPDVWWFGFDCAHGCDVVPGAEAREREMGLAPYREPYSAYRTVGYVQRECARLAEQLAAARSGVDQASVG